MSWNLLKAEEAKSLESASALPEMTVSVSRYRAACSGNHLTHLYHMSSYDAQYSQSSQTPIKNNLGNLPVPPTPKLR